MEVQTVAVVPQTIVWIRTYLYFFLCKMGTRALLLKAKAKTDSMLTHLNRRLNTSFWADGFDRVPAQLQGKSSIALHLHSPLNGFNNEHLEALWFHDYKNKNAPLILIQVISARKTFHLSGEKLKPSRIAENKQEETQAHQSPGHANGTDKGQLQYAPAPHSYLQTLQREMCLQALFWSLTLS